SFIKYSTFYCPLLNRLSLYPNDKGKRVRHFEKHCIDYDLEVINILLTSIVFEQADKNHLSFALHPSQ
ncbi:hypothetical protein AB4567_02135, partial [Vibrio sp. 10N.222.51.A6]